MEVTAESVKARWGQLLQAKRQESGETQAELATRIGLFSNTIARAERGEGGMKTFIAMANALGVDLLGES